jgi:hypothetical protein
MPHIHIEHAGYKAVIEIPHGNLLAGDFPEDRLNLVLAWIEIHKDDSKLGNIPLGSMPDSMHYSDGIKVSINQGRLSKP